MIDVRRSKLLTRMIHILVICPYCPYPPDHGGSLCVYGRLAGLSDQFVFHLVCPPPPSQHCPSEAQRALGQHCRTVRFYERLHPRVSALPATIRGLLYGLSPRPAPLLHALGQDVEEVCAEIATLFPIQVVSLEHSYSYGLVDSLLNGKHAALFKDSVVCACEQNVEYHIWRDAARDPLARGSYRIIAAWEAAKMLRYTRNVYNHLDRAICISSADRDELLRETKLKNISAGRVVIAESSPRKTKFSRDMQVIFCSTVGYFPNRDGLVWLYREVWPLVRREQPTARLVVTGHPDKSITAVVKSDPSIELTGFLPKNSLTKRMIESSVFVSPIRLGSGIKLKNVMALSYGLPIVATSKSMQGIPVQDRRDAWLADDPVLFAEGVVTFLRSEATQRTYSENAHKFFQNNYTRAAAADDWCRFYEPDATKDHHGR